MRACSSAVNFSPDLNRPVLNSNPLEYHPEAPGAHNATAVCVQVEEVPLRATPEGLQYFSTISSRFVNELCCLQHTFVAPILL